MIEEFINSAEKIKTKKELLKYLNSEINDTALLLKDNGLGNQIDDQNQLIEGTNFQINSSFESHIYYLDKLHFLLAIINGRENRRRGNIDVLNRKDDNQEEHYNMLSNRFEKILIGLI